MKKWQAPIIEELKFTDTEKPNKNNGNNDTHKHKGWCEMHWHPENNICTCGAYTIKS